MRYNSLSTSLFRLGWLTGALILVMLVIMRKQGAKHLALGGDGRGRDPARSFSHSRRLQKPYATCPNCRFKLATSEPPSGATYPFNVIHCPVCGYRLDEFGFELGKLQTEGEKRAAADTWMMSQRLMPDTLRDLFGVGADELFENIGADHLSEVLPYFADKMDIAEGGSLRHTQG
jgi:DNA-directed RNA polymerase subunit RPC12/RpoP